MYNLTDLGLEHLSKSLVRVIVVFVAQKNLNNKKLVQHVQPIREHDTL